MNIDWPAIISSFPSMAVALLFAWFAMKERTTSQKQLEKIMDSMDQRTKERDSMWKDLIVELTQRYNDSIGRLTEEMKENDREVATVVAVLQAHDQATQSAIAKMEERTRALDTFHRITSSSQSTKEMK